MSFTTYLLTIFCAITFIQAVSWDGAQTTSLSSSAIWNLNPTPAPLLGGDSALLHSNDLRRRQAHSGLCGYKNGDMGMSHSLHTAAVFDISMQSLRFPAEMYQPRFALRSRVSLP